MCIISPKEFVSDSLESRVLYQFTCASCGARYIGESNRHLTHVLMTISFEIPTSLNISELLKGGGIFNNYSMSARWL